MEMGLTSLSRYSIEYTDSPSAKAEHEWVWEYSREDWQAKTKTNTFIIGDLKNFYLKAESIAWEGEVEVFRKQWDKKYLRGHF